MKRLATFFGGVGQVIVRIICAAAAVLFMQFPVYVDQYVGILVQAREEARPVYESTQQIAFRKNFSPEAYLDALESGVANKDSLQLVKNTFDRYNDYDQKIATITEAPLWQKPWVFAKQSEKRIREAMEFQPALNYNWESAAYGILGVISCSFLLYLLAWPIRRMRRSRSEASSST